MFAQVPAPYNPEAIAVRGNRVYTGTTINGVEWVTGTAATPSRIHVFDRRTGAHTGAIEVTGEDLSRIHGIAGLAFDGAGRLYAADIQRGVLRFDLERRPARQERYATVPDLPSCMVAPAPCSPTRDDREPLPNEIVFDRDGTLYVTDSWQATIWRIPPGGGEAQPWFSSPRIDGFFGPNGIRISPDRRWVYLAQTYSRTVGGALYRLPLVDAPQASQLEVLRTWSGPDPDGMAIGRTGRLYLVLGGSDAVVVLEPDGTEVATYTSEHFANVASPAFDGSGWLLVANHAFFEVDPRRSALTAVYVGDREGGLVLPSIPD